jgi:hypothetical protein
MSIESHGGIILTGKPKNSKRNLSQCGTGTDLGTNPGLCGERPTTNCLSHDTAQLYTFLVCSSHLMSFIKIHRAFHFYRLFKNFICMCMFERTVRVCIEPFQILNDQVYAGQEMYFSLCHNMQVFETHTELKCICLPILETSRNHLLYHKNTS